MESVFTNLTAAVSGAPLIALAAALAWGALSIVLSPCHLASIPLIVGHLARRDDPSVRRSLLLASVFSVGILLTVAAIGLVTAAAGRMLGDVGHVAAYAVVAIFLLMGLYLMDVIPLPLDRLRPARARGSGTLGAFTLGLVFGVALGPCTFAFMAPVLGTVLAVGSRDVALGAGLLGAYGVGHCGVIVVASISVPLVQRYLEWGERG